MNSNLSITIVAYHNYEQIKIAIESIEKFINPQMERVIYISDNSVEDTGKAEFKTYLSRFEDVIYIDNKNNLGFGRGHNVVLDFLKSDYHAIVNPDIEVDEDVFSSVLTYMDENPNVGMVIPKIVDQKGTLQAAYRKYPTVLDMFIRMFLKPFFKKRQAVHTLQDMDYSSPFQIPFAQGCFLVIRTELFKYLNGFDDRFFMYMEDADLCRRVNEISRVMYYPKATVMHAWEKGSHKNKKLLMIHIQSMVRYFTKWGWQLF